MEQRQRGGRPAVAVAYGGGAIWGIGWGLGVARALADAGWPIAGAPSIGTSAGAWVGAAVALGCDVEDLQRISFAAPEPEAGDLVRYATEAFGCGRAAGCQVVVSPDGTGERVLLDLGAGPAARAVAASSAVPGIFAPVTLGEVTYVDGMCGGSVTNVDLAPAADCLVVIAPTCHPDLPGGLRATEQLDAEVDAWLAAHPGATVRIFTPDPATAALPGDDPMALFRLDLAIEAERRGRAMVADLLVAA